MPELVETSEIENIQFRKEVAINKNRNYIDDDALTAVLTEWAIARKLAIDEDRETPPLPDAAAIAIMDMSEALGKRFNFSGYSYLQDMQSDAILHCVKYIHNFNPLKKSDKKGKVSAFGYINMIIWRSFTHRIEEEHKQQYLKYASFIQLGGMEAFQDEEMIIASGEDGEESGVSIGALGAEFINKAKEYEEKHLTKKFLKDKTIPYDNFMFDLDDLEESELVIEFE